MEIPENIQKLGVVSLFDFVLKFPPKDYQNTCLSKTLEPETESILEVIVQSYSHYKVAKALCYAPLFDCVITLVIFNAKPYHKGVFKAGETLIVSGKLQKHYGDYHLLQPKILKQTGKILPQFSLKGAKGLQLQEFSNTLKFETLTKIYPNVPEKFLKALEVIYNPDENFYKAFKHNKGWFGVYLEALKFVEIYEYMRKLQSKKIVFSSLTPLKGEIESWIATLPFVLTQGQKKAISEIKASLNSDKSARRVIVGDVGCGKTMVIFASVMIALPYRSVLMVPTSILAKQIYQESQKYLSNIKVALLSQTEKIGQWEDCDFLIGTHALLFQNLSGFSLVMIDEQHRFGTSQRNALEKMFKEGERRAHILQFSATPIPRTLAMIESNYLDFSFILDLPFPKDITSKVIGKQDFKYLLEHIRSEIAKENQVIIVYPLVEQSESMDYLSLKEGESYWQKHFEGVYVTHGKDKEKEAILEEFREKGRILLATTVIEVGISLPKLSTIIIVGAERLGLATLHQLRGRVSRNGLKGYCFLYTNTPQNERLGRFCQTLNGFEIAKMDLEYRNSGDLLSGQQQSGKPFEFVHLAYDALIIALAKEALINKG